MLQVIFHSTKSRTERQVGYRNIWTSHDVKYRSVAHIAISQNYNGNAHGHHWSNDGCDSI